MPSSAAAPGAIFAGSSAPFSAPANENNINIIQYIYNWMLRINQ